MSSPQRLEDRVSIRRGKICGTCILCNILDNDEITYGQSISVVNVGEFASSTNVHIDSSNVMDVTVSVPFALVDEITDASLATEDGASVIADLGIVEAWGW
ncbi:hypothetical protein M0R45_002875 [Rubus argutus]|uniref:Uncharacterized protein n=1 Tax=Rubus argutus TaxID=59490 RepID=A0AAW1VPD8_RUBAR